MVTAIRPLWEMFKRLPLARVNRPPSIDAKTEETQPGGLHTQSQLAAVRANEPHAFGLQKGCRTGSERRVRIAISLQIAGGRTWIRTTHLLLSSYSTRESPHVPIVRYALELMLAAVLEGEA